MLLIHELDDILHEVPSLLSVLRATSLGHVVRHLHFISLHYLNHNTQLSEGLQVTYVLEVQRIDGETGRSQTFTPGTVCVGCGCMCGSVNVCVCVCWGGGELSIAHFI